MTWAPILQEPPFFSSLRGARRCQKWEKSSPKQYETACPRHLLQWGFTVSSESVLQAIRFKGPFAFGCHCSISFRISLSSKILGSPYFGSFQFAEHVVEHKTQGNYQFLKLTLCKLVLQHNASCSSFTCSGSFCQGMHNKDGN